MANISQNVNIEMLEKLPDGTYKRKYPKTLAKNIELEDTAGNFTATELEGAMQELFTNVSNGKQLVGGAITGVDENIVIPTDPSFNDLANAIGGISTGRRWSTGTATFYRGDRPTVRGLAFKPSMVVMYKSENGSNELFSSLVVVAIDTDSIYTGSGNTIGFVSSVHGYALPNGNRGVGGSRDNVFYEDGFTVGPRIAGSVGTSTTVTWIAFE